MKRQGPKLFLQVRCDGCIYEKSEYYACQSDTGFDYTCHHPDIKGKHLPSLTPDWCPLKEQAIRVFKET